MNTYKPTTLGNWHCFLKKPINVPVNDTNFLVSKVTLISPGYNDRLTVVFSNKFTFQELLTVITTLGIVTILSESPIS